MKKSNLSPMPYRSLSILILICFAAPIFAHKMVLKPAAHSVRQKRHPFTEKLLQTKNDIVSRKSGGEYQKLLVILVDFQEDSDTRSTGNGKFMLEADPDYIYSVGAPPHDRQYFEANLEAMRYYYLAASAGSYELEYDVWPKDKPAYTLSQNMGYYNPPDAESSEFVEKMEEYFKEAFETADRDDPEIDFAAYAHYMIIHAGSDWQHDIAGDSPLDIPSFFIKVGDGKQVEVDDGNHEIFHACNVPATISQDFQTEEIDGQVIHSGYGALNSVLFHEFGHSLGLVDLYNVRNFSPMVGAFDIMDSGGSGVLVDQLNNGDFVYLEGAMPVLPGAFSRLLLFEEDFENRGLFKEVTDLKLFSRLDLAASSLKQSGDMGPSIIRFQINPDEYYLIENRNLDPDGDGGTAVYGTLEYQADPTRKRVILYPTAYDDNNNSPTYEYDYLLPSFIDAQDNVHGGGILAWRVNEKVLYQEGTVYEDGSFASNFDTNYVNTSFSRPGVMVLEADGIRDLGEYYSQYWTGTAYEYFHAHKPFLNNIGQFMQWSPEEWRPRLSSQSKPAMLDEKGLGTMFYLDEISDPAPIMNFVLKAGMFEESVNLNVNGSSFAGQVINTSFGNTLLPFSGYNYINLYSDEYGDWSPMLENEPTNAGFFDYPLINMNFNNDQYMDLVGVSGNLLYLIDISTGVCNTTTITFPDSVSRPLVYEDAVYVYDSDILYKIKDGAIECFVPMEGIKNLTAYSDCILATQKSRLMQLSKESLEIERTIMIPEEIGDYEPVICMDAEEAIIFVTANNGNIYRYAAYNDKQDEGIIVRIFSNTGSYLPSQPALIALEDTELRIFFGLGNNAYMLSQNGYLHAGFPRYLDKIHIEAKADAKALRLGDETLLLFPVAQQGYIAVNEEAEPRYQYSLLMPHNAMNESSAWSDFMYYDEDNHRLLWYYSVVDGQNSRNYIHSIASDTNPILWNGYLNSGSGVVYGSITGTAAPDNAPLHAYVFPNPVKSGIYRLRVENASADTKLHIYDISGSMVYSTHKNDERFDLELDSKDLSSGVYVVHVKSGVKDKTFKFAVEK
ncbi:MAG: T9SS type A sorting domain-containing protein [Candidatus Cloacimonetes bacterium]|nr:T9SS type A sorting domain-containing protein [Candidatus Cloacimonadota bacterium]MDD2506728.1 T9SS type A sorting domain-containing protein [Candidatus Cloacimonadota bacterium]